MHKTIIPAILLSLIGLLAFSQSKDVKPTAQQVAWANAEVGVIIHLDINIYAPESFDYAKKETLPGTDVFNPGKLNTDQWIRTAKAAGARYALLTVKHGTGFCLWPSKVNPYNVGHTKWRNGRGDILKDFLASCKKYGLKPGLYYNTNSNTYYEAGRRPFKNDSARITYNRAVLQQLTELWTEYGKLFEIWFDGGITSSSKGGIENEVTQLIDKYQKQAILFQGPDTNPNIIRWIGNEDGIAAYPQWARANTSTASDGLTKIEDLHGDPDGKYWCPGESDFPIRRNNAWNGGWLWRAGQDNYLFTVKELEDKYLKSVGRNTNMLVGMVVDTSGLIPRQDSLVFDSLGKDIKNWFTKPVIEAKEKHGYTIVMLPSHKKVHMVVLRENIAEGEHIRKYVVEAKIRNKWSRIAGGESIGHKRIQIFDTVFTNQLRFRTLKSAGNVKIKSISFY
jgi:alpha-L-fucosidase